MTQFELQRNELIKKGIYPCVYCSQMDDWGDLVGSFQHPEPDIEFQPALDLFLESCVTAQLLAINQQTAKHVVKDDNYHAYFQRLKEEVISDNKDFGPKEAHIIFINEGKPESGVYRHFLSRDFVKMMDFKLVPSVVKSAWAYIEQNLTLSKEKRVEISEDLESSLEEYDIDFEQAERDTFNVEYSELVYSDFTQALSKDEALELKEFICQPFMTSVADFRFLVACPSSLYLAPYGTRAGHFFPILAGRNKENCWEFTFFAACN